VGALFCWGCLKLLPHTSHRALCHRHRFGPHTPCRCVKLACKQQEWVSSPLANTRAAPALSLRLGHVRGKTVINCFFTLSRRFATRRETFGALVFYRLPQISVGAFSLWGLSGAATLHFGSGSVEKAQIRYAYLGKSKKPRKLSGTFLICSCNYLNNRFYCFCGSKNRENS